MASTADTSYKDVGGRLTKFSSIPEPPKDVSPATQKFLAAIKETVEVREGKRGNALDRSIIVRDLFDPAFTNKYWPDGGSSNTNTTPAGQEDTTPPPPVTSLVLDQTGETSNVLTWVNPVDADITSIVISYASVYPAIPLWTSQMQCTYNKVVRYAFDMRVYTYIHADTTNGIAPDDLNHGYQTDDAYWRQETYPYKSAALDASILAVVPAASGEAGTYTHDVSGSLSTDFYYWVRAKDGAGNHSSYVPTDEGLLALAKTSDDDVPIPTGLTICETGSTEYFNDLHVNLCWNPSSNIDVTDHYEVEVYDTSDLTTRIHDELKIQGCKWTYSYSMNEEDHGGAGTAEDSLTFKLWAVDYHGRRSEDCATLVVTNPAPDVVTNLAATSLMEGVYFTWSPSASPDVDVYSYRIVIGGSITDTGTTPGTSVTKYRSGVATTITIYVKVVDTWGNESAEVSVSGVTEPFVVEPTDILDFPAMSAKMFPGIPVVHGVVWTAHSPSSTYIAWSQHYIYYKDPTADSDEDAEVWQINAGNTAYNYVYWSPDFTPTSGSGTEADPYIVSYQSQDVYPPDDTGLSYDPLFVIAVNTDGVYTLAWNSQANTVIGSAYIMAASIGEAHIKDASINNAHIVSLHADKITGGTLQTDGFELSGGVQLIIADEVGTTTGDLKIGDPDTPSFFWDQSAAQLTLRGAIMQNSNGDEFPVPIYRGAYSGTVTYYEGDLVTYAGSSWICVVASSYGVAPSNELPGSTNWDCYAAEGDAGEPGEDGTDGVGAVYQGEWMPGTTYYGNTTRKDLVKYLGVFYICQADYTSSSGSTVNTTSSLPKAVAAGGSSGSLYVAGGTPTRCSQVSITLSTTGSVDVAVWASTGGAYSWITIATDATVTGGVLTAFPFDATWIITAVSITNRSTTSAISITAVSFLTLLSTATPDADTAHWSSFGTTFSSVATDLVLANDVNILRNLVMGWNGSLGGVIRSYGKATFDDSKSGFWMGMDDDGYAKFKFGGMVGSEEKYIAWNGSSLTVEGQIITNNNIVSGAVTDMDSKSGSNFYGFWAFVPKTWSGDPAWIYYGGGLATTIELDVEGDKRVTVMASVTFELPTGVYPDLPYVGAKIIEGNANVYGTVIASSYALVGGYADPAAPQSTTGTTTLTIGATVTPSSAATTYYSLYIFSTEPYGSTPSIRVPSFFIHGLSAKR